MTHTFFAGFRLGLLPLMFLPVLIAILRGRLLVAVVAFLIVLVSIVALIHPLVGMALWRSRCASARSRAPR